MCDSEEIRKKAFDCDGRKKRDTFLLFIRICACQKEKKSQKQKPNYFIKFAKKEMKIRTKKKTFLIVNFCDFTRSKKET